MQYHKHYEDFKESLYKKIESIPENDIIEPSIQKICLALENAKYCLEEKQLREMFANLIANSLNRNTESKVHPSFSEIIKQMSALDAENLLLFTECTKQPISSYPIIDICLILSNNEYFEIEHNIFIANKKQDNQFLQTQSIDSLCRLGLLEIFSSALKDSHYKAFYKYCKTLREPSIYPNHKLFIRKKKIQLTTLGMTFLEVCFSKDSL